MTLATNAYAKIAIKTFDYEGIDPEAKSRLIYLAAEAHKQLGLHVESAIQLGETLALAQSVLAGVGQEGKFKSWVESECGFSRASAYRYIAAFRKFSGERSVSALRHFTLDAVFALSPESVPQVAIDEAVKIASKGTRINRERADEILAKFRQAAPKKKPKPKPEAAKPVEPEEPEAEEVDFEPAKIEAQPHATVDLAGLSAPYKQSVLEIGAIINRLKKLADEERTGGHLITKITRIVHCLDEAKTAISEAEPVRICPKCDGKGCHPCAATGFWTRAIQKSFK